MPGAADIRVGDRVLLNGKHAAIVRYIGPLQHRPDDSEPVYGLELEKPREARRHVPRRPLLRCPAPPRICLPLAHRAFLPAAGRRHARAGLPAACALRGARSTSARGRLDAHEEDLALQRGRKTPLQVQARIRRDTFGEGVSERDIRIEPSYSAPASPRSTGRSASRSWSTGRLARRPLHYKHTLQILGRARRHYEFREPCSGYRCPGTTMTVVGDHGQLQDLLTIFTINGLPSETNRYFFNGDFVDRGRQGVEIVLILAFKPAPHSVH